MSDGLQPTWSAHEQVSIDAAAAFVDAHVRPHAAKWAQGVGGSHDVLKAASDAGLLGLQVAVPLGGKGLSFSCKSHIAGMLAGADFGLAMSLINTHNIAQDLSVHGAPDLAMRYVPDLLAGRRTGCTALTEPGVGSDFSAITTRAQRVGDAWQIDGDKAWIINATHADVIVLYAQTEPGGGAQGIAAFVIDGQRDGFVRGLRSDTTATRGLNSGSFTLQGYQAHADELLYPPGQAFKAAMNSINGARTYVASMCCAMVAECLRVANVYGDERHSFGQPLHSHQGWRWALADAAVDLAAARQLVALACDSLNRNVDAQTSAAHAKVFATRMAGRHIAALMHAMGAEGLREEYPFMRHLAGAQVASLTDGSTEMLLERIAKDLRRSGVTP